MEMLVKRYPGFSCMAGVSVSSTMGYKRKLTLYSLMPNDNVRVRGKKPKYTHAIFADIIFVHTDSFYFFQSTYFQIYYVQLSSVTLNNIV